MANTVMTAKNTFGEGLIMDFAPDNTQATCLTSALNATLLTFNGNEMSLQNDMGNGRVETAYLPEGYMPVGTCEFGDIIYIVSYNPLTKQAQIGCFPSPERNISSEEIYYEGKNGYQNLNYLEFQEVQLKGNKSELTGKLKQTSVKKVLIDSKKLNPGDKYIIYTSTDGLQGNESHLSDLHIDGQHNKHPKFIKLHVVSIDETNKITYLDTSVKWYDITLTDGKAKYYINSQTTTNINGNTVPDIDSYRNLLQSGWSIFSSKISGKLAILAELETIDTFSCSYDLDLLEYYTGKNGIIECYCNNEGAYIQIKDSNEEPTTVDINLLKPYIEEDNIRYKKYRITLLPDWYSDKNIDIDAVLLTKAAFNSDSNYFSGKGDIEKCVQYFDYVAQDIKNIEATEIFSSNTRGYQYYEDEERKTLSNSKLKDGIYIGTVKIPYQQKVGDKWENINSPSFVYTLEITPTMPFGMLDHLAVTLTIDFNKVGTGEVDLTDWKYHNSGTTSILQYGLNIYPKPKWEVDSVIIQFADNIGLVGEYLLSNKKGYSGMHTEYFGLDGESYNYKFSRINSLDNSIIGHPGALAEKEPTKDEENEKLYVKHTDGEWYLNDARTLYSGFLYMAKIVVKQRHKHRNDKITISKPIYRWYWTNAMFNEYFYQVKDFKDLKFELILDGEALFETNDNYIWKTKEVNNLEKDFTEENTQTTRSANIQYIGEGKEGNINMYIKAGLQNDYDCFNLYKDDLQNIQVETTLQQTKINYTIPEKQYEFSNTEVDVTDSEYLELTSKTSKEGWDEVDFTQLNNPNLQSNIPEDQFGICFVDQQEKPDNGDKVQPDNKNKVPEKTVTLDKCYYMDENNKEALPLSMQAILFNKAYTQNIQESPITVPVYTPIINSKEDLENLGIQINRSGTNIDLGFSSAMALGQDDNLLYGTNFNVNTDLSITEAKEDPYDNIELDPATDKVVNTSTDDDFVTDIWSRFSQDMKLFFPVYIGGVLANGYSLITGNSVSNFASAQNWKSKWSNLSDKEKHYITNGFDLDNRTIDLSNDVASIPKKSLCFLGMKHKKGMTLLNSAFFDSYVTKDNKAVGFAQKEHKYAKDTQGVYYSNFASQLYLILSNTYHKNKRAGDSFINVRNYVRNGYYTVELEKNIVIKLYVKPDGNSNFPTLDILVKHIKLSDLKAGFKNKNDKSFFDLGSFASTNNNEDKYYPGDTNITLKLLDFAKSHDLKIKVKNKPLSMFNNSAKAYISRNGILYPSSLLTDNFYIYQDGQLNQYSNKVLNFNIQEVSNNLTYLLGQNSTLAGARSISVPGALTTDDELFNKGLEYIYEYFYDANSCIYSEYTSEDEAKEKIEEAMNAIINGAIGSTKKAYHDIYNSGFLDDFLLITKNESNNQFYITLNKEAISKYKKIPQSTKVDYYTINSYFNLGKFKYENELILESYESYNTFGIVENDNNDVAYGGFIRDVVINKDYQVI